MVDSVKIRNTKFAGSSNREQSQRKPKEHAKKFGIPVACYWYQGH
jgi:hypothetical protein